MSNTYYVIRRNAGNFFVVGSDLQTDLPGYGYSDLATAKHVAQGDVICGRLRVGGYTILAVTDGVAELVNAN